MLRISRASRSLIRAHCKFSQFASRQSSACVRRLQYRPLSSTPTNGGDDDEAGKAKSSADEGEAKSPAGADAAQDNVEAKKEAARLQLRALLAAKALLQRPSPQDEQDMESAATQDKSSGGKTTSQNDPAAPVVYYTCESLKPIAESHLKMIRTTSLGVYITSIASIGACTTLCAEISSEFVLFGVLSAFIAHRNWSKVRRDLCGMHPYADIVVCETTR